MSIYSLASFAGVTKPRCLRSPIHTHILAPHPRLHACHASSIIPYKAKSRSRHNGVATRRFDGCSANQRNIPEGDERKSAEPWHYNVTKELKVPRILELVAAAASCFFHPLAPTLPRILYRDACPSLPLLPPPSSTSCTTKDL